MHRTDSSGNVSGLFVDKVPGVSPGTLVVADSMNALQEELCTLIEARGVTLVKGTHTQLATALAAVTKTTATLAANWTAVTATPPKYYKDSAGVVHLEGAAGHATNGAGEIMLTLPVGFRPSETRTVPVAAAGTSNAVITSDGNVTILGSPGTNSVYLDSIHFHP